MQNKLLFEQSKSSSWHNGTEGFKGDPQLGGKARASETGENTNEEFLMMMIATESLARLVAVVR